MVEKSGFAIDVHAASNKKLLREVLIEMLAYDFMFSLHGDTSMITSR
jgi:hypothetical protein